MGNGEREGGRKGGLLLKCVCDPLPQRAKVDRKQAPPEMNSRRVFVVGPAWAGKEPTKAPNSSPSVPRRRQRFSQSYGSDAIVKPGCGCQSDPAGCLQCAARKVGRRGRVGRGTLMSGGRAGPRNPHDQMMCSLGRRKETRRPNSMFVPPRSCHVRPSLPRRGKDQPPAVPVRPCTPT